MWNCWMRLDCKSDNTAEFVTMLNRLGLLNEIWSDKTSEICETFVYDENVKRDQTIEFVTLFNMWTVEWD